MFVPLPILLILSVGLAVAFPFFKQITWPRSLVKTGAVAVLAVVALQGGHVWLALALALSAFGDLMLSRPGDRAFLAGMIGFAGAHLLYAALMAQNGVAPVWPMILLIAVALILGWRFSAAAGALAWPVRIYVALIAVMGLAALGQPNRLVLLGALMFMASDAVIGQEKFLRQHWPGQGVIIWALYYAAQVALLFGLGA